MKKVLLQFLVSVLLFGMVLFSFSRVDWLSVLHIRETVIEEKLGELYWKFYSESGTFVENDSVLAPLDSLLTHLCEANDIEKDQIKLHVIRSKEINAFAFPDNHLVIYSSLITTCENEMELCGVMAHELAHMKKGHIMKKLLKEVGLSVLVSVVSGDGGTDVLSSTAKLLSSTAYDRTLESEADRVGVAYLLQAKVNPQPFSELLFRLSVDENLSSLSEWVSTHPDSEKRSIQIADQAKTTGKGVEFKEVLNPLTWQKMKSVLSNN